MKVLSSFSLRLFAAYLLVAHFATPASASFMENFDSYPTGTNLHGVGGWKGWQNNPAFTAFTTNSQARSSPNSVEIAFSSDLVHEFSGYTSGVWEISAWQYIPGDFAGAPYFILLNSYDDGGVALNWSTQVQFNSPSGLAIDTGVSGATWPLTFDEWVELRLVIDLDADTQSFYYGPMNVYNGSWTNHVSGGGILNIAALDLFANGATSIFYDDISITAVNGVPEPTTLLLLGLGLAGLGFSRRRTQ